MNDRYFNLEVKIPPNFTESVYFSFPRSASIDAIKAEIFKATKSLQNEDIDNYLLGVKEDDLLYVEFAKLLSSHQYIKNCALKNQTIVLMLVPKKEHALRSKIPQPTSYSPHPFPKNAANIPNSQSSPNLAGIPSGGRGQPQSLVNKNIHAQKTNSVSVQNAPRKVEPIKFQSAMQNPQRSNPNLTEEEFRQRMQNEIDIKNKRNGVRSTNMNNQGNNNNNNPPNSSPGSPRGSNNQGQNIPIVNNTKSPNSPRIGSPLASQTRPATGSNIMSNNNTSFGLSVSPTINHPKSTMNPNTPYNQITIEVPSKPDETPLDHCYYQNLTSELQGFPLEIKMENGPTVVVNYKINTKIDAFKSTLISQLQKLIEGLQKCYIYDSASEKSFSGEDIIFPYSHNINPEHQNFENDSGPIIPVQKVILKESPVLFIKREDKSSNIPHTMNRSESVLRRSEATQTEEQKSEKITSLQIGNLIGRPLVWSKNDLESYYFRSSIQKDMNFQFLSEMKAVDIIRAQIANCPIPSYIKDNKYPIRFYFTNKSNCKTVLCSPKDTIMNIVSNVITKEEKRKVLSRSIADFMVRIYGTCEFIFDNIAIGDLVIIREALKRSREIAFVIAPRYTLESELNNFLELEKIAVEELETENEISEISSFNQFINIEDISKSFELKLHSIEISSDSQSDPPFSLEDGTYTVECRLYHAMEPISQPSSIRFSYRKNQPIVNHTFSFPILTCNLPKATRVVMMLYSDDKGNDKKNTLGWGSIPLVNFQSDLKTGQHNICISTKPIHFYPILSEKSNNHFVIELPNYPLPVVYVKDKNFKLKGNKNAGIFPFTTQKSVGLVPSSEEETKIASLLKKDCLSEYTADDKTILWKYREYYRSDPLAIIPILSSVPWESRVAVKLVHMMLEDWAPLNPYHGLILISAKFSDERVREYGVFCLRQLKNEELSRLMLQLVQALKYEPYHDSCLARFLLQRSICDCRITGSSFFWNIQAELNNPATSDRFTLLMESFLRGCGAKYRSEFIAQMDLVRNLKSIAKVIQQTPAIKRTETLKKLLTTTHTLPSSFILPSSPQVRVTGVDLEKCKTKDSFTAPLWLVFKVQENEAFPYYVPVIFKLGDDLRQDSLTLQIIRMMDIYWKNDGLDLEMSPYNVTSVGDLSGFIEVVRDSKSLADIQKEAGGAAAVAFSKTPLFNWLRKHNPTDEKFEMAIHNYTYSYAGYSVASFLLGLADRHNDNILISRSGHLLHIDFAHFLGNYMTWKGIPRETAPFIVTPETAHVMGGVKSDQFQQFVALCCRAFNILRQHANSFLTLCCLMINSGLTQLNSYDCISYMKNAFMLELTDEEAAVAFTRLIDRCLSSIATRAMFVLHVLAHPDKGD